MMRLCRGRRCQHNQECLLTFPSDSLKCRDTFGVQQDPQSLLSQGLTMWGWRPQQGGQRCQEGEEEGVGREASWRGKMWEG